MPETSFSVSIFIIFCFGNIYICICTSRKENIVLEKLKVLGSAAGLWSQWNHRHIGMAAMAGQAEEVAGGIGSHHFLYQWAARVPRAYVWDEELTKSSWVRITWSAGRGDIVVGVCWRPPGQEWWADEALYRAVNRAVLCSQALILMGNFNHPDICWRDSTAGYRQYRRFLKWICVNSFSKW